ncbi:hypothetical protein [Tunturiibacter gelidoferens]|uniref:Uncharacterized protein n=1 Tax=Tunturiibacter gelidiferens TaxID=3069689 RepID=A0A9X0U2T6_9BACT|nr:hypothetical protein [Edaphobacter lichenicola]MBB5327235.1 hypothetical protein [Edaphobacter lichenicola]
MMASLSDEDRTAAIAILEQLRAKIAGVAGEDRERLFQLRRYILKRLEFDESGTPTQRRKLKDAKRKSQLGLCALCQTALPERGAELDRFRAIEGYTARNTHLVCHSCHQKAEAERGFT